MKKINFFISFDHFNFSDIKNNDLNNLKKNFVYYLNEKFHKLSPNNDSINSFHLKIFGNNNNLFFYTGVEHKLLDKMKEYEEKIKKTFYWTFNEDFLMSNETHCVKLKVGKDKQFSLCGILLIIDYKNVDISNIDSEFVRYYILFPITFGDFHK